ncbi:class A beta-lactamase-related serine hydrolase [Lacrimispora amygdalina]|uniref:Class A beta-lactamase-related serine hydrolase n=1 Tax=Lacrimispora amygdalina TaxID=253257 RepID=A0A3E2NEZ5_9FIRM|nr:serine hydrolase domain-containing protein [Clostridium indicum]RFZ79555.1 class A beta-lactamase-related serine hydrolase [Clostridium indicum]
MKKLAVIFLIMVMLSVAFLSNLFRVRLNRLKNRKDTGDLQGRIDQSGEEYLKSNNGVGLVIGVVQRGNVYIQGYGRIRKESDEKPDEMSLFELASVGKLFTAAALEVFTDRGDLSASDSIDQYLADVVKLPKTAQTTTLMQLATHTSGFPSIPDSLRRRMKDQKNPYKSLTKADLYEYLSTCQGKKRAGHYKYSNFGMGLLGHLFELKYKDTYENIIKKEICTQLDMENTTITMNESQQKLLAQGYDAKGAPNPVWEDYVLTGAGSFLSNAEDMVKFIKANLYEEKTTLSASLFKTHVRQMNGKTGLGWHFPMLGERLLGLNDIIWHNGMAGGYSSYIAIDKEDETGIIILSNTACDVRALGVKILLYARNISLNNESVSGIGES